MNINRLLKLVLRGGVILNNAFSIAICLALSLFLCTSLVSCAGGAGGGGSDGAEETALSVTFPQTMAAYTVTDLATYSVTIESSKYTATKSGPAGGTITFTNIPVGTYKVTAYGKKADGTIAAKNNPNETSVTIEEGKTKTTVIRLHLLSYYTVTFKSGYDNSVIGTPQQVTSGEKATKPANPASPIPDSSFVNWYSDDDCTSVFSFNTPINADIEVYAKFSDVFYTVTLNYNGGQDESDNTSSTDTYSYNDPVPEPTVTKTGYTRLGWTTTADAPIEDVITSIPNVTGNATYYAKWTPTTYTVTYHLPTGLSATVVDGYGSYTYGTGLSTLPGVTGVTGLSLEGWYEDSAYTPAKKVTSIASTATGDKDLYAKFNATVKIYKEKVSGTLTTLLDTKTVVYGGTVTALATAPTKTGYVFDTWKTGTGTGSAFTFGTSGTTISGDCDVWATWTPSYTITYHNVNEGSGSTYKGTISATDRHSYTYNATSSTSLPTPTVSDTNYEFGGWYETSNFSDTGVTAVPAGSNEDKDYYAMYKYKGTSITCSIEDFNAIDGFSGTSITWRVTGSPPLSAIASAIASKGIDVDLDLTAGGISTAIVSGTFDSIIAHLVGISLPGGMTTIETNTFKGYDKLTSVWFPPTVNSIEVGAFDGCTSLATVDGLSGSTWQVRNGGGLNVSLPLDDAISTFKNYLIQADKYFDRLP